MPISNPILTINQGVDLTLALTDPVSTPEVKSKFWFNHIARNLFLAIDTNSVADWIPLGGSPEWGDIQNKPNTFPSTWDQVSNKPNLNPSAETILNKIVVADGQVLTTEDNADLVRLLLHLSDRESLKQPLALSGRLILTASVMSYGVLLTIWDL